MLECNFDLTGLDQSAALGFSAAGVAPSVFDPRTSLGCSLDWRADGVDRDRADWQPSGQGS